MKQFLLLFIFTFTTSIYLYSQIPGDGAACHRAMCLSEQLGNTFNNDGNPVFPPNGTACGESDNNMFFAFCAEVASVNIGIESSNCEGMDMGGLEATLLTTTDCMTFTEIDCIANPMSGQFIDTIGFRASLIPGQTYFLMIDGFMGDFCDFRIEANGIRDLSIPPAIPDFDPPIPTTMCVGDVYEFDLINTDPCAGYRVFSSSNGILGVNFTAGGLSGRATAGSDGFVQICLEAANVCTQNDACFDIEILPVPRLDFIADITVCEPEIDFCDYNTFFDPELSPDPLSNGWDISFHTNLSDAQTGDNPLACPFSMANSKVEFFYIRTVLDDVCSYQTPFTVTYMKPRFNEIKLDDYCGPTEVDLSVEVIISDIFSIVYSEITFYREEADAEDEAAPISPPIVDESGTYWVRVETDTDPACHTIASFDVLIVNTPQLDLDPILPVCALDTFSFDLKSVELTETTGEYDVEDLDIRYFDFEPTSAFELGLKLTNTVVTKPGTYYVTAVIKINSRTNPYCFSDPIEIVLDTVGPPFIEVSGITPPCAELPIQLIFDVDQEGEFNITYELTGGNGGTFNSTSFPYFEFVDVDPFTDTVWVKITDASVVNGGKCQPKWGDSIFIAPPIDPLLRIYQDTAICRGDTARMYFEFNGTEVLEVEYTDGTNFYRVTDIRDGSFIELGPIVETTYTLVYAIGDSGCEIDLEGEITVRFWDPPSFEIIDIECLATREYTLEIQINGGVDTSYTIDENPQLTNPFITDAIANGGVYLFELDDEHLCGPVEITGTYNCSCDNSPGTMSNDRLNICIGDEAIGIHNMDEITLVGDLFYFILHTSPNNDIGIILDSASTPMFTFDPATMTTGVVYYISAFSGDDDGNGAISREDSCALISVGQELVFIALPEIDFGVDVTACNGDMLTFDLRLTGEFPITFNLNQNGVLFETITVNQTDTTITIIADGEIDWDIPWIQDVYGCENTGNTATLRTSIYPEVMYTYRSECNASNTEYRMIIEFSAGMGPFEVNAETVMGNEFTTVFFPSGSMQSFDITDANGCNVQGFSVDIDCNCATDAGTIVNDGLIQLCENDSYTPTQLNPAVLDGNDIQQYILFSDISDPLGTILFYSNAGFSFNASMTLGQSYFITSVAADDNGSGNVLLTDPCISVGNIIEIVWNANPTLINETHPDTLCNGDDWVIQLEMSGNVPLELFYTINAVDQQVILTSLNAQLIILAADLNLGQNTISLNRVANGESCESQINDSFSVFVKEGITVSNISAVCEADKQNYVVTFTVSSSNYLVNNVVQNSTMFSSGLISSSGPSYSFTVRDPNGCGTVLVEGTIDCDCPTPGTLPSDLIELCGEVDVQIENPTVGDFVIFVGDTYEYLLHEGSGITIFNLIGRSPDGTFTFDPITMTYGNIYYISRVVGDDDGTGAVDLTDPCAQNIAQGQPVVWYSIPQAGINGDPTQFIDCDVTEIQIVGQDLSSSTNVNVQWTLTNGATSSSDLTNLTITASTAGDYTLELSTGDGTCVSTTTMSVVYDGDVPDISLVDPEEINCLQDSVILDARGSSFDGIFEHLWTLPNGSEINVSEEFIYASTPGTYRLTIINTDNNCTSSMVVVVTENKAFPIVDAGTGGAFNCDVDTLNLSGSITYPSGAGYFRWSKNGVLLPFITTLDAIITGGGDYVLEATDANSGCVSSDNIRFEYDSTSVYDALVAALSPICFGDRNGMIEVEEVYGGPGPYEFSVNGGDFRRDPQFDALGAGTFSLRVRDANGCIFTTTIVLQNPPDIQVEMGNDTTVIQGEPIYLAPIITGAGIGSEGDNLIDTLFITFVDDLDCDNCTDPEARVRPLEGTNYEITIITKSGCIIKDSRFVNVKIDRPFFVPTAFSPNGDGINDKFTLFFGNLFQIESIEDFGLYDRWGNQIASAETLEPAERIELWNGFFRGELLNPQVLVWTVTVFYKDGWKETYAGDITMLR